MISRTIWLLGTCTKIEYHVPAAAVESDEVAVHEAVSIGTLSLAKAAAYAGRLVVKSWTE